MRRDLAWLVALALLAGPLLLMNLDGQILWQDEAQTALVGRTVLEHGLPYGTDGRNSFSQELGAEYDEGHLWRWHTWLQFYLVAAAFAVAGEGTLAARLPFALCGLATVLALYGFTRSLGADRASAGFAGLLLALCVPFLLLARQCRYYAPCALFTLLGLWGYRRAVADRPGGLALFAAAGVLLFHTHPLYAGTLLASVLLHAALFQRPRFGRVVAGCGAVALLCAPWALWMSGIRYGERYAAEFLDVPRGLELVGEHLGQLDRLVLPWLLLALPLLALAVARRRPDWGSRLRSLPLEGVVLLLLFPAVTLLALGLTSPGPFFRYLAPVLPPLAALGGVAVGVGLRLHPAAAAMLLVLALWRQPLPDFAHELTHEVRGPVSAILEHLDERAEPGDVVAISYGDMPLKFYTDLRVVGGLTGEDLTPALTARFVILRRERVSWANEPVRRFLGERIDPRRYRRVVLEAPDLPFENREALPMHRFRSVSRGPRVVILERIDSPDPAADAT